MDFTARCWWEDVLAACTFRIARRRPRANCRKVGLVCPAVEDRGFHHILKTGCRAEDARLRTAECVVKLIAVVCILAWRVFWTTMVDHAAPEADARLAVTADEIALLDHLVPDRAAGEHTL